MSTTFKIKTDKFEGPIDLLLTLIEKRQLHINDVALATVSDDYINYIQTNEAVPVNEMANFLVVASTLLLIKSISLLPGLPVTSEEEASIEELENRLKLLQETRRKSVYINEMFGKSPIFERDSDKGYFVVFSPSRDLSLSALTTSIQNLVRALPKVESVPKVVVQKVVSLEQMISSLTERIQKNLQMSFRDFVGKDKTEKISIVVGFLAVLELVKQGVVSVKQSVHLADIEIETAQFGVPTYGNE